MQVHRVRRQSRYDEWPMCNCCNENMEVGWEFYTEEKGSFAVCDDCLNKAKKSPTGYHPSPIFKTEEEETK